MPRATQDATRLPLRFAYGAVTLYGRPFQGVPLRSLLALSWSFYPGRAETPPVWATPRSLATTCGITVVFSSCGYLDVSVPRVRLPCGMAGTRLPGCPIRTSRDLWPFAPPPGFSQLVTSFLASESLGIHRLPFLAFLLARARAADRHVFSLLCFFSTCSSLPSCQRPRRHPSMPDSWRITDSNR